MPSTPDTVSILALAGSYRLGSFNQALISAAREEAPRHVTIESFDLRNVPHYDGDVEAAGDPEPVRALKRSVVDADALLIASPEFNGGIPGVLKNGIDWASRRYPNAPISGKLTAIVGATPGRNGTRLAQEQLRRVLDRVGAIVLEPTIMVARAGDAVAGGTVVADAVREELRALVGSMAGTVQECRASGSAALAS